MKSFITAVAVLALVSASAVAGNPSGHKSNNHHHKSTFSPGLKINYNVTYGKQFNHGWYYPGKVHTHWSYQSYWPKYGCTCYWCPSTSSYYYWYAPGNCYYPISYISKATPVFVSGNVVGHPPVGVALLPK